MTTQEIQIIQRLVFEMAAFSHRDQLASHQNYFGTLQSIEQFVETSGFECSTPQQWAQEYIDSAPEDSAQ